MGLLYLLYIYIYRVELNSFYKLSGFEGGQAGGNLRQGTCSRKRILHKEIGVYAAADF
jgi:hypothetical protein